MTAFKNNKTQSRYDKHHKFIEPRNKSLDDHYQLPWNSAKMTINCCGYVSLSMNFDEFII